MKLAEWARANGDWRHQFTYTLGYTLHQAVSFSDFYIGLIKAPVMAFFIAVIGCMHGLRVSGSAESVGKETTAAVVKAIFLVLALDAVFSILFERLGI